MEQKEVTQMKTTKAQKVTKYVKANPTAKPVEVAKATGTTYGYAYKTMRKLKEPQPKLTRDTAKPAGALTPAIIDKIISDGSTAMYYVIPKGANELQDLISHKNMNAQIGEIFRACYRYGEVSHSDMLRDAKKIKFYAEAEIKRLEKLNESKD